MSGAWDPNTTQYQEQEEVMIDFGGNVKLPPKPKFIVSMMVTTTLEPSLFAHGLHERAVTGGFSKLSISALKTADGRISTISPKDLAL